MNSLLLLMILECFTKNSGAAMNPARDFGPRLFIYMIGYGGQVFTAYKYFFWIPIVGPTIGAIIATYFYDLTKK
jgi:glycerol uptake facilitator-like aquaporin